MSLRALGFGFTLCSISHRVHCQLALFVCASLRRCASLCVSLLLSLLFLFSLLSHTRTQPHICARSPGTPTRTLPPSWQVSKVNTKRATPPLPPNTHTHARARAHAQTPPPPPPQPANIAPGSAGHHSPSTVHLTLPTLSAHAVAHMQYLAASCARR